MKKLYQKPSIKVRVLDIENILQAASPIPGGNAGITAGDPKDGTPVTANGKSHHFNIWDN